jgi:hypothetical protein
VLKFFLHEPSNIVKHSELRRTQIARLAVDNAESAHPASVGTVQGNSSIEPHARITHNGWIVREAIVFERVSYD